MKTKKIPALPKENKMMVKNRKEKNPGHFKQANLLAELPGSADI